MILWDWRRQAVMAELTGHQAPVAAVEMSVSGEDLASGDRDGFIFIWDTAKNLPKQVRGRGGRGGQAGRRGQAGWGM